MRILTLEEHRTRIENLRRVTEDTKKCTRDWRIHDYLPGQVTYYLGDYPALMSITPTEYDYKLLKSYAENGVGLIQVHEEWNDTIEKYGSDKWHSCDHEGMNRFIDLCHSFGLKIIPYCSSSYIHEGSKYYQERFSRSFNGCVDMHYKYRLGWAGSEYWRDFILPKTFGILDTYDFDGIYNDWGYDWDLSHMLSVPENRRNCDIEPVDCYDPEAEDLIHMIYSGVKDRGGIYKLHVGGNTRGFVRGKYYDYLWIGEGEYSVDCGKGKMYEPYVVPCPDKPRLTKHGQERFDPELFFAMTIPFVQFPLLTHGRPTMGKCIDVPGVKQYKTTDRDRLYQYFRRVRDYAEKHPDGPYVYSEWSQIPDDPDEYTVWSRYLRLYKPMVEDESVVHMEIRETAAVLSPIPGTVYITQFTNTGDYIVVSNMADEPYMLETRDLWQNRETGDCGKRFEVPAKRMLFLVRREPGRQTDCHES